MRAPVLVAFQGGIKLDLDRQIRRVLRTELAQEKYQVLGRWMGLYLTRSNAEKKIKGTPIMWMATLTEFE